MGLFGSSAKVKSAWQQTPGPVKDLVTSNAQGLTGISKDATAQYNADKTKGYQQYGGERVAGFDPAEQQGLDMLSGMPGQQAGLEGQINGLGGLDLTLANHPEMIQKLYNPYQSGVIDTTMSDLDHMNQMEQMRRNAAAGAAGSFNGSRAGVNDALAMGEQQRANAAVLAGMRKEGWDTASGLATKDLDRTASYNTNYMDVLRGLYDTKGSQTLAASQGLAQLGGTRRGIEQSQNDVSYGDFMAKQNYPWMNMERAQGILGKTNPATDAAAAPSTTKPSQPSALGQIAGMGTSLAGAWLAGGR